MLPYPAFSIISASYISFYSIIRNAEEAFLNAKEIKERIGDKRSLTGTLIGLSDAYRCLCKFEESQACLEEAMEISLDLKDDHLSHLITASIDAVERSKNNHAVGQLCARRLR